MSRPAPYQSPINYSRKTREKSIVSLARGLRRRMPRRSCRRRGNQAGLARLGHIVDRAHRGDVSQAYIMHFQTYYVMRVRNLAKMQT